MSIDILETSRIIIGEIWGILMAEVDGTLFDLNDSIFNGILFATNADEGPALKFNASSLSDREAIATTIQGITAVGLGEDDIKGLFGPLPVPYNPQFKALVYIFKVESTTSTDPLVLEFGRFCALFIIFEKSMLRLIANVFSMIESLLNIYQESYLLKEEDLIITTLQLIYEDMIEKLKIRHRIRPFKTEQNITVEFEDKNIIICEELTFLIDEKEKIIHYFYPNTISDEASAKLIESMTFINETEYQDTFKLRHVKSKRKFLELLETKGITILT